MLKSIKEKIYSMMEIEISNIADELIRILNRELDKPVKFAFTSKEKAGFGSSDVRIKTDKKYRALYLGCREIKASGFNPQMFVNSLVALFHEAQHFQQLLDIQKGVADDDILFSNIASYDRYFYEDGDNYRLFYTEWDADYNGVLHTLDYMKEHYPQIDAVECIKGYLKQKENVYGRYVEEINDLKSVEDVSGLFLNINKEIVNSVKGFKHLPIVSPIHRLMDSMRNECMVYNEEYGITSGNLIIEACDTNIECDKFASMAVLMAYPEYIEYYPDNFWEKLKSLNMDYFIQKAIENKEQEKIIERDDI